jgi:hypothetical protein
MVSSHDRLLPQPFLNVFGIAITPESMIVGYPNYATTDMQPSIRPTSGRTVYDEASITESCWHFCVRRGQAVDSG